jgi:hypothetical protein
MAAESRRIEKRGNVFPIQVFVLVHEDLRKGGMDKNVSDRLWGKLNNPRFGGPSVVCLALCGDRPEDFDGFVP